MALVEFLKPTTIAGVDYHPGQLVVLDDKLVFPLLQREAIRVPTIPELIAWQVSDPVAHHGDPRR